MRAHRILRPTLSIFQHISSFLGFTSNSSSSNNNTSSGVTNSTSRNNNISSIQDSSIPLMMVDGEEEFEGCLMIELSNGRGGENEEKLIICLPKICSQSPILSLPIASSNYQFSQLMDQDSFLNMILENVQPNLRQQQNINSNSLQILDGIAISKTIFSTLVYITPLLSKEEDEDEEDWSLNLLTIEYDEIQNGLEVLSSFLVLTPQDNKQFIPTLSQLVNVPNKNDGGGDQVSQVVCMSFFETDSDFVCDGFQVSNFLLQTSNNEKEEEEEEFTQEFSVVLPALPVECSYNENKGMIMMILTNDLISTIQLPSLQKRRSPTSLEDNNPSPLKIQRTHEKTTSSSLTTKVKTLRQQRRKIPTSSAEFCDELLEIVLSTPDFQWIGDQNTEGYFILSIDMMAQSLDISSFFDELSKGDASMLKMSHIEHILFVFEDVILSVLKRIAMLSTSMTGGGIGSKRNVSNKYKAAQRMMELLCNPAILSIIYSSFPQASSNQVTQIGALFSQCLGITSSLGANVSINSLLDDGDSSFILQCMNYVVEGGSDHPSREEDDEEDETKSISSFDDAITISSVGLSYIDNFFLSPTLLPSLFNTLIKLLKETQGNISSLDMSSTSTQRDLVLQYQISLTCIDSILRGSISFSKKISGLSSPNPLTLCVFENYPQFHWITTSKTREAICELIQLSTQCSISLSSESDSSNEINGLNLLILSLSTHFLEQLAILCPTSSDIYPFHHLPSIRSVFSSLLNLVHHGRLVGVSSSKRLGLRSSKRSGGNSIDQISTSLVHLLIQHQDYEGLVQFILLEMNEGDDTILQPFSSKQYDQLFKWNSQLTHNQSMVLSEGQDQISFLVFCVLFLSTQRERYEDACYIVNQLLDDFEIGQLGSFLNGGGSHLLHNIFDVSSSPLRWLLSLSPKLNELMNQEVGNLSGQVELLVDCGLNESCVENRSILLSLAKLKSSFDMTKEQMVTKKEEESKLHQHQSISTLHTFFDLQRFTPPRNRPFCIHSSTKQPQENQVIGGIQCQSPLEWLDSICKMDHQDEEEDWMNGLVGLHLIVSPKSSEFLLQFPPSNAQEESLHQLSMNEWKIRFWVAVIGSEQEKWIELIQEENVDEKLEGENTTQLEGTMVHRIVDGWKVASSSFYVFPIKTSIDNESQDLIPSIVESLDFISNSHHSSRMENLLMECFHL